MQTLDKLSVYRKGLLQGKKGVILGLANRWRIAWGIANSLYQAGADIILTYQDRVKDRVEKLAEELAEGEDKKIKTFECDVTDESKIDKAFENISTEFDGKIDFVVHSLAFAKKDELEGRYINCSKDGYLLAQEVSSYSLVAVSRRAEPLLRANGGGSIITLSYLGGERVVQNYNVMGVAKAALESSVRYLASDLGQDKIRVNAISAGPIKTLASSAISGIQTLITEMAEISPLRKNIESDEVGDTALFLVSDLSRGITGEVIHVDAGFHVIGAVKAG